jgi:hypothetical protein
LEKLKERFDIDLKKNYKQVSFNPNLLLLNKKVYLLYNYFNKKKEFLLLSNNKNTRYIFNYIGFFSLNFFLNIEPNIIKIDYFKKWSSSLLQYSDGIIRNFFDDINEIKKIIEPTISLDYKISDNIFNNYNTNINNYFYLNKNMYIYNFFFKLTKKDDLKFKTFYLNFLLDYYLLLNNNYNNKLNVLNWKNNFKLLFISNYFGRIKYNLKLIIKTIVSKYYDFKKNNFFFEITLKKKLFFFYFLRYLLKNNKKKHLLLYKEFFNYIYFLKKLNKRFFGFKLKKKKKHALNFFKEKFLPIIYLILYKNLKRRTFLSFFKKSKKKKYLIRTFFSFIYNLKFNDRFITKKNFLKKKKYIKNYRIIKKLKTFYYIPDVEKTRKHIYKRFKRSVYMKFYRKKLRKKKRRVIGLKFNLSVYNHRNRYKHRMKMLALKNTITPKYFFFKKKKNNYMTINSKVIDIPYKEVPFFVKKRYKLNVQKKKKRLFLKKDDWMKYKIFKKIKNKSIKKNKKDWINLYNSRTNQFKKKTFFQYIKFFKDKLKKHRKKNKSIKIWKYHSKSSKISLVKKNHSFWFFQKILLYWKNLLKFKRKESFINYNYINNRLNFFRKIYKRLFILSIKFFNFCILKNWIKNHNSIFLFMNKYLYLYKIYLYIYIHFIKKINLSYKSNNINIVRWLKKKKKRKWFLFFKRRRKFMLLKKQQFLKKKNLIIK